MKKDCCLSLRQESNQIPKYRGYDERQQPMLIGIYAVYTIGLGTKNATVFSMIVVTLGVSLCKYTLIFHFSKIFNKIYVNFIINTCLYKLYSVSLYQQIRKGGVTMK